MENKYFEIKGFENKTIRGMKHTSENWNGKVVVFLNGYKSAFTDGGRAQRMHSIHLCEQGFDVVRFDYLGYGESDGDFSEANISSMVRDTKLVIENVNAWYDNPKIILSGGSMGGLVTLATANSNDIVNLEKIVLHCPALDFYNVYMNLGFKDGLSSPMVDVDRQDYINTWETDLEKYKNILNEFNFEGETLIFHGDKDPVIPYEPIKEFSEKYNLRLITVQGTDHSFKQEIKGPEGIRKNFEIQNQMWKDFDEFVNK